MKLPITLNVNDHIQEVWTSVHRTLLEVLREELFLTGTKHGCELGECGACSVLIDGRPTLSCLVLPIEIQDKKVVTVEGIAENGRPHELQTAFAELGAAQCGYCTPGMLISASALLEADPRPDEPAIREALSGNLCRCTGYNKIIEAVELAAERTHSEYADQPGSSSDR